MPINAINPHAKVKPADIPLEKLATSKALSEDEKTQEMTRQFEAMLLRQIFTEAQKTAIPSKFSSTGVTSAIYQDMMINQLADSVSSSRTIGLAQELEKQVSRQVSGPKALHAPATAAHASKHEPQTAAQPAIPLTKAPRL